MGESFFVLTQRKQSRGGGAEVFWKGSTASQDFSLLLCVKTDSHPFRVFRAERLGGKLFADADFISAVGA